MKSSAQIAIDHHSLAVGRKESLRWRNAARSLIKSGSEWMNRHLASSICGICLLMQMPSSGIAGPIVGLVASYDFNGNANDLSGNSNDGTITGATFTTDRFGNTNSALSFNNDPNLTVPATDFVTIADSSSLQIETGITISSWVKPFHSLGRHIVAKQFGGGLDDSYVMWFEFNNAGFSLHDGNVVPQARVLTPKPTLNEWHHVAGTWDGDQMRFYIDGSLRGSTSLSGPILYDGNPVLIGADDNNSDNLPDEGWNGLIDDVRIYDRGLSDSEILDLFNETSSTAIPEPSTFLLMGLVVAGMLGYGCRRRSKREKAA